MAPAAKMRMISPSRTDNLNLRRPSHETRQTGLMIYFSTELFYLPFRTIRKIDSVDGSHPDNK